MPNNVSHELKMRAVGVAARRKFHKTAERMKQFEEQGYGDFSHEMLQSYLQDAFMLLEVIERLIPGDKYRPLTEKEIQCTKLIAKDDPDIPLEPIDRALLLLELRDLKSVIASAFHMSYDEEPDAIGQP
jgi:hypothetical protein